MPKLTMPEAQAVSKLAELLCDFLPGTYSSVTWPDVAARFCLEQYWKGGNKRPAIRQLLTNTLELHRDRFCDFIVAVVQEGLSYRHKKKNPVQRSEICELNQILLGVKFKIPELHDSQFLEQLPGSSITPA